MRVGILQTQVPFVTGGAERHSANLCAALREHGHDVAEITLPFKWYPGTTLVDSILAARLTDLSETEGVPTDLMIGLRFPAYLARHPNKVFWIIHQFRQAYDQWDTGVSELLGDPDGEAIRHLVRAEDRKAFAETARPVYANSETVAQRLQTHLGQKATPLYHPPPNAGLLSQGPFGDYLFAPGRLNPSKRPELLLRALARTGPPLRLVIAGKAENPDYLDRLRALADELGVAGRVEWLGGIDDDTMRMTYANARAVVFVPQDEDYGYITLEAMLSGKPVITTEDAGGPLEFVTDGKHGLICAASPGALAEGFETVMQDRRLAERMGAAGHKRYRKLGIGWDRVVETLTGQSRPRDNLRPAMVEQTARAVTDEDSPAAPRIDAVAELRAAIAPVGTQPEDFPFRSISDVFAAYDFETLPPAPDGGQTVTIDPGIEDYLGTHWTRFLTTLDLVADLAPETILNIGTYPPLAFEAMVVNALPGADLQGLCLGPHVYSQHIRGRDSRFPDFDIHLEAANIERDPLPYAAESFDLVMGMEIFEHLVTDPYFFLSEACRALRPGGHILLSTPNVVSHRGVWKALNGQAPYSFGLFVPSDGVYGRHNREYTPREVESLAAAAGFETRVLKTVDVYDDSIDPGTAELLHGRDDDLALRGETIFFVGKKTGEPGGVPEGVYHGDPARMSGALRVALHEEQTGLVHVEVTNSSRNWWPVRDQYATCLLAEWTDPEGILRHTNILLPLNDALGPGDSQTVTLRLDAGKPDRGAPRGTLWLELFQKGVGRLSGTGRAKGITLPCSEDAFVRLVRRSA